MGTRDKRSGIWGDITIAATKSEYRVRSTNFLGKQGKRANVTTLGRREAALAVIREAQRLRDTRE
jgi:hypothetical protein